MPSRSRPRRPSRSSSCTSSSCRRPGSSRSRRRAARRSGSRRRSGRPAAGAASSRPAGGSRGGRRPPRRSAGGSRPTCVSSSAGRLGGGSSSSKKSKSRSVSCSLIACRSGSQGVVLAHHARCSGIRRTVAHSSAPKGLRRPAENVSQGWASPRLTLLRRPSSSTGTGRSDRSAAAGWDRSGTPSTRGRTARSHSRSSPGQAPPGRAPSGKRPPRPSSSIPPACAPTHSRATRDTSTSRTSTFPAARSVTRSNAASSTTPPPSRRQRRSSRASRMRTRAASSTATSSRPTCCSPTARTSRYASSTSAWRSSARRRRSRPRVTCRERSRTSRRSGSRATRRTRPPTCGRPASCSGRRSPARHPFGQGAVPRAGEADRAWSSVARLRPAGPGQAARPARRLRPRDRPGQAAAGGRSSPRRSGARRRVGRGPPSRAPRFAVRPLPALPPFVPKLAPAVLAALFAGWVVLHARVLSRVLAVRARSARRRPHVRDTAARPRLRARRADPAAREHLARARDRLLRARRRRGWSLFWPRPRTALLFVAGPLLAPLGLLALIPLVVLPAGDAARRAAQAAAAVLAAAVVAALAGHALPIVGGERARPRARRPRRAVRRSRPAPARNRRGRPVVPRDARPGRGRGRGRRVPPPRAVGRSASSERCSPRRPCWPTRAPPRFPLVAAAWLCGARARGRARPPVARPGRLAARVRGMLPLRPRLRPVHGS